jgi:hypothetical protein
MKYVRSVTVRLSNAKTSGLNDTTRRRGGHMKGGPHTGASRPRTLHRQG